MSTVKQYLSLEGHKPQVVEGWDTFLRLSNMEIRLSHLIFVLIARLNDTILDIFMLNKTLKRSYLF